jgi:hypothetical protein
VGISEKTVELNISRVVIEKCRRTHQLQAYSMGLTQAQEAGIGADVFIETMAGWTGGFIQYKAMHRQATGEYHWHLNRTTHRDQHSLLCILENAGYPVFYCFPMFDDASVIAGWTPPPLWKQVTWASPNAINVPAPIDKHHHVEWVPPLAPAAAKWNVYSKNPTPIPPRAFLSYDEVEAALLAKPIRGALSTLLKAATQRDTLEEADHPLPIEELAAKLHAMRERLADVTRGLNILAFGPPTPDDADE